MIRSIAILLVMGLVAAAPVPPANDLRTVEVPPPPKLEEVQANIDAYLAQDNWPHYDRATPWIKLRGTPQVSARLLLKKLTGLGVDIENTRRGIYLFKDLPHPDSIKGLATLYRRWRGPDPESIFLRCTIIDALGQGSLSSRFPDSCVACLEDLLRHEPSPPVVRLGLAVLSYHAPRLDAGVVWNALGKVPLWEIVEARCKVKLNAEQDFDVVFRQVFHWYDGRIAQASAESVWQRPTDRCLEQYSLDCSMAHRLMRHRPALKEFAREIEERLETVECVIEGLEHRLGELKELERQQLAESFWFRVFGMEWRLEAMRDLDRRRLAESLCFRVFGDAGLVRERERATDALYGLSDLRHSLRKLLDRK